MNKPLLTNEYTGPSGVKYIFEYSDTDSFDELPHKLCRQMYSVCFYEGKMVIVYHGKTNMWGLVGGTVEPGETLEKTLIREIEEESNMRILKWLPIGYQKMIDTRDGSFVYQLRTVSTAVPIGPFEKDPAGTVTEMKLVSPAEYKNYFDWGEIGERIVARALELKPGLE